jgi:hypothetical protein
MAAGIVVVGLLPLVEPQWLHSSPKLLWLLLALLAVTVLRRGFAAVQNPTSQRVQTAVKQGILSLIMFDAAICLFLAPTWYAIAVVALLAPALLLGKWLYST